MEKQNPVQRIWELGKEQHGSLITAVLMAVVGVVCGMIPYVAAARIIALLLGGEAALSAYTPWLAAALLWRNGSMTLPHALMVLVMSFLVFSQIKLFGMGVSMLRMAAAAIDRTVETEQMPQMDESGRAVAPEQHDVVFDHVSFSYEDKPILRDVSVTIPDRTTTAIVGPSGSGKTTFCNLIARFWDVDSGHVRVGDTDVRDYTLESLMEQVSMVFQNVYLFADTIENNIKFGYPDATHEQVAAAAKKARCDDFIEALPEGYDTVIGEGGASLSCGEKQRISIARAMLKDAPIIILDEATANVDPENEDRRFTERKRRRKGKGTPPRWGGVPFYSFIRSAGRIWRTAAAAPTPEGCPRTVRGPDTPAARPPAPPRRRTPDTGAW